MKRTIAAVAVLAAIAASYLYLPLTWRRHKDIEFGNRLIQNLENYRTQHGRLPENDETAVLEQLQFKHNQQGWQPNYQKLGSRHFLLVYADGYVRPHLMWDSEEQQWRLTE